MTDTEQWRAMLVSTKDIEFSNRQITIETSSEKPVKIDVPDIEVICNGCNQTNTLKTCGVLNTKTDLNGILMMCTVMIAVSNTSQTQT